MLTTKRYMNQQDLKIGHLHFVKSEFSLTISCGSRQKFQLNNLAVNGIMTGDIIIVSDDGLMVSLNGMRNCLGLDDKKVQDMTWSSGCLW